MSPHRRGRGTSSSTSGPKILVTSDRSYSSSISITITIMMPFHPDTIAVMQLLTNKIFGILLQNPIVRNVVRAWPFDD